MTIHNVALVGGNGQLGRAVLTRLLSVEDFTVTALTRESSKSTYPPEVSVVRVSDSFAVDELVQALQGQDAVVVTIGGMNTGEQLRMADASLQAGVKRFIPADFGSCDSTSARALELVPLYVEKQKVRHHLMRLASSGSMSWTALVCGHFFDSGFKDGFLHFDLKTMKADILDDGNKKWSATTLDTIGLAVVRILQRVDETRNRMLYIQSFCVSQNEVLDKLKHITRQEWDVTHLDSEKFVKENKSAMDKGERQGYMEVVFAQGLLDANWKEKDDFANGLLGLENEDLELVIRRAIA